MATNEQYGSWHADNEFTPTEGSSGIINVGQNERILSAAAGALLLSSGLSGLFKNPIGGLVKTALGGLLLYRGTSGHCPVYASIGKTNGVGHTDNINIRTSLIVNKPRAEVYAFWRKLENLPLFMKHLASVTEIDAKHSHWEASPLPGALGKIKWNAEIVKEEEGRMIGWQSIPNATINNAGKVTFNDALNGQGTELEVVISYHPPAGELGAGIAKLLNPTFEKMIRQDVLSFKEYIETKHTGSGTGTAAGSTAHSTTGSNANVSNFGQGHEIGTGSDPRIQNEAQSVGTNALHNDSSNRGDQNNNWQNTNNPNS